MKSKRHRKETEKDRLSDLCESVLLHIMKFMDTKQAVQTCVLSTRWKKVWQSVTTLALNNSECTLILPNYNQFVFSVLSHRDNSISLQDIDLRHQGGVEPELVDTVMKYGMSHNVQNFTLELYLNFKPGYTLRPYIFSCKSLTHLKLYFWGVPWMTKIPPSFELPALKSLHLIAVSFVANDNGIVDPFSNCKMLSTLVLDHWTVQRNASVLCISNSKLSSLSIGCTVPERYKVVLSTPNLNSISLTRGLVHQVYVCDLSVLEEVNIDVAPSLKYGHSGLINWLQALADYVKILALSSSTLEVSSCLSCLLFNQSRIVENSALIKLCYVTMLCAYIVSI